MSAIVTDVERAKSHSTPRSPRSASLLRRVGLPALTVVTVCSGIVPFLARPAGADAISDARAKAAAIEAQLSQDQNEMSLLGQQYDEARTSLSQIDANIATTQATIATDRKQVGHDKATLAKAAVANYITDGTASTANPIFSGNESTLGAQTEYNQIAEGNIDLAVDNLHTAENSLNAQVSQLQGEQSRAQAQVAQEQQAIAQNQQVQQQQQAALNQEQGQIATLVKQQQEAEAAAAARAAEAKIAAAQAAATQARGRAGRIRPYGRPADHLDVLHPLDLVHLVHDGELGRRLGSAFRLGLPGAAPDLLGRAGRRRSGREPDRRALCLGRRVTYGVPPTRASTARASPPGPGARSAYLCPTTRAPRWPTRRPCRSVTSNPATSSSTGRVATSTSPCTSAPAR